MVLRARFSATVVTQAASRSIDSPRSRRSHARASASCTESSAVATLPHTERDGGDDLVVLAVDEGSDRVVVHVSSKSPRRPAKVPPRVGP